MKMIKDPVIGTIIGDIVGSIYEIHDCKTGKNFNFFSKYDRFTDDSVMTLAVTQGLLQCKDNYNDIEKTIIDNMVEVGLNYSRCGYGPSFLKWLKEDHKSYGSYGNGAAMRVSSIPMFTRDINEIKSICSTVTNVSHNHEESILGSEALCMSIYLALNKKTKDEIKEYIESNYFKLEDTVKSLAASKTKIIIKCIDTVKASIICFLESNDYEDAIRNAISIGGDSDTIGAITGGLAAAYYGVPEDIFNQGLEYLDERLKSIYYEYYNKFINNIK